MDLNTPEPTPASGPNSIASIPSTAAVDSVPFPIRAISPGDYGTTPSMPPHMASVRSHTAEDIVQMMNRTPLFMTSLEATGIEDEENIELEAIRALQYEGTVAENAQSFKEQGNDMVKSKRWKDGRKFYTKAIALFSYKKSSSREVGEVPGAWDAEEHRKEKALEEACYVNRALCNLELRNYRSTIIDCAAALRLNPKNIKAYYRSSLSLLTLDKFAEALDACSRGLAIEPTNTALSNLNIKIMNRQKALEAVQQKKQESERRSQQEKIMLVTALRARNIRTRTNAQVPDTEDAHIHLAPDPISATSTLMFPVVLLYPLHLQSDFIKAFPENDTVTQHLEYIFPAPWDEHHAYRISNVEYYIETASGGLLKVGKNVMLGKVLGSSGVEIVNGIVKINIVLKSRAREWIEDLRAKKGK